MKVIIGAESSLSATLTADVVERFAEVTGDSNPVHLDEEYAKASQFGQRIGHGLWAGALISAVLGTRFPGPGTVYLSQQLTFHRPVYLGETVTATVRAVEIHPRRPIVTLETTCHTGVDTLVLDGKAVVMVNEDAIDRS